MNARELAARLNGRQYGSEITEDEEGQAEESGLVVVFGYSDDNMEFRGAVDDEVGCWHGDKAYLTREGLLSNDCDDGACPYFHRLKDQAATIEAVWDKEGYSWIFRSAIPHATFDIWKDGEKYCRGIVFALTDVK